MRKAALAAGTVQLLSGVFTVVPQIFGTDFSSAPGQAAFRLFTVFACLVLAIFFFAIVIAPAPEVSRAVGISSLLAAGALSIENLSYAFHNILRATAAASQSSLWEDHPIRQFAHVLGLAIPTLAEITMVVFLLVVFARSLRARRGEQGSAGRTRFLGLASLIVAAMFVIAMAVTFFPVILSPRAHTVSTLRLLLRFATLSSFAVFYSMFGISQRRNAPSLPWQR